MNTGNRSSLRPVDAVIQNLGEVGLVVDALPGKRDVLPVADADADERSATVVVGPAHPVGTWRP